MPGNLSIIILAHNEAENLPACLDSVANFGALIVVDSGSTDGTQEIARRAGAQVYDHPFSGFGAQRNWAIENCEPKREWILFLDADEVATPRFRAEVERAIQSAADSMAGFYCCWKMMLGSQWLRRSDSFPKWQLRIVRRGRADFIDSGHGQKEGRTEGELGYVREPYLHYALIKGWEAWWAKHNHYAEQEAIDRLSRSPSLAELFSTDPSRRNRALKPLLSRMPGWPLLRFIHMYVLKGGFLEGREGFAYCASMGWYEELIRAKMSRLEQRGVALD
ncbi:MAG TPA: glycosyltransferase family 2 protein [Chthoniobacterales bacterium]|nr:glycosyltransferase family 2 protein [Chthoniobacterales bacterium]